MPECTPTPHDNKGTKSQTEKKRNLNSIFLCLRNGPNALGAVTVEKFQYKM
jgi:hypothetical protein